MLRPSNTASFCYRISVFVVFSDPEIFKGSEMAHPNGNVSLFELFRFGIWDSMPSVRANMEQWIAPRRENGLELSFGIRAIHILAKATNQIPRARLAEIRGLCAEWQAAVSHMGLLTEVVPRDSGTVDFAAVFRTVDFAGVFQEIQLDWIMPAPVEIPARFNFAQIDVTMRFYEGLVRDFIFRMHGIMDVVYPLPLAPLPQAGPRTLDRVLDRLNGLHNNGALPAHFHMFDNVIAYLSTGFLLDTMTFIIKCHGGEVVFDPDYPFITHEVCDEAVEERIEGRFYCSSQWIFQSIVAGHSLEPDEFPAGPVEQELLDFNPEAFNPTIE